VNIKKQVKPNIYILVLVLGLVVGCTTTKRTNVETVAFKTLNATATTVHSAMQAYADVYVAGKVSEEQHARISRMHDTYRISIRAAIVTAQFDTSQPTPNNVVNLATHLVYAITELL
jgi:hypothetical protein